MTDTYVVLSHRSLWLHGMNCALSSAYEIKHYKFVSPMVRFDSLFTFGVFKSPRYINKNNFISSIT